jgi:MFS family permease
LLQIISGFAISMAWSGGQTLIAHVADGDAEYIGRFSSFARVGTTVAPPIVGFLFDLGGAWLAYGFGTLWAICAFFALLMVQEPKIVRASASAEETPFRVKDVLPRKSDYTSSFAMMAIPAVAFAAVAMLIRNSSYGIQTSVYVTHLEGIGFTATKIGFLFSAIEMSAALGSWFAGRTMRRFDAIRILVVTTSITIILITITPLLTAVTPLLWAMFFILAAAQIARGITQGVSQPILFSVMAKSVGPHQQGAVVGLRQTMNRLGGIIIPPMIGVLSDAYGRELSFYITGAVLLTVCVGLALYARKVPPIKG